MKSIIKLTLALILCFSVIATDESDPGVNIYHVKNDIMDRLRQKKNKFDEQSIGYSFAYQEMLLERIDKKTEKDLFAVLSKAFVKRYFEYFIQIKFGLRNTDISVETAFQDAARKKLIDLKKIEDGKLNFGSAPKSRIKTPYGIILDEQTDKKLSEEFREHVIRIVLRGRSPGPVPNNRQ